MKSPEEHLAAAKQRALICVDRGGFSDAVAGLRADLAENPLTKDVSPAIWRCAATKPRWTPRSAEVCKHSPSGSKPSGSDDKREWPERVLAMPRPGHPRQAFGGHANASAVI